MYPIGGTLEVLDWIVPLKSHLRPRYGGSLLTVSLRRPTVDVSVTWYSAFSVGSFTVSVLVWRRLQAGVCKIYFESLKCVFFDYQEEFVLEDSIYDLTEMNQLSISHQIAKGMVCIMLLLLY